MQQKTKSDLLIRYKRPGRYDRAPFNTLCKVIEDDRDQSQWYIQVEKDIEKEAWWIEIGMVLTGAFLEKIFNDRQRQNIVQLYFDNLDFNSDEPAR